MTGPEFNFEVTNYKCKLRLVLLTGIILHAGECQPLRRSSGANQFAIAFVDCPAHSFLDDFTTTNGQQSPGYRTRHVTQKAIRRDSYLD